MNPWFAENDKLMFYKYLDKATTYFEWGSGGSTYQANSRKNISKIYSVESDKEWFNKLQQIIKSDKIVSFYNEMDTRPKTCGHAGPNSTPEQKINYSNHIRKLSTDEQQKLDFILIDGRFRVACCLKSFELIKSDCIVVFDDFLNRPLYHVVLNYYDMVEKTADERMVILRKKAHITSIPPDVMKRYELDGG